MIEVVIKTVIKTVKTVEYKVLLTNGRVTVHLSTMPRETGPYKYCRNLEEADLYSLNVLRQNVKEGEYKGARKKEFITREFLGHTQSIESIKIIPTMKWIQETFPEKLI